tara:strand:- start:332 stop:1228 length:897 start_codon:yes stop_codon:yes gene_type:complete
MSKRIVIIPTFCDSHLIKFQIPNIVETINPDYIIYNEGLFPGGPESSTNRTDEFIKKYTLDGTRGFDFNDLEEIIENAKKIYPNVNFILNKMSYNDDVKSASQNAINAYTNFNDLGIDIKEGDYIFPFEGDVFHHESSADEINGYIKQIKPNQGFKSIWIDYLETQFYTEKVNWEPVGGKYKQRKICVCYGDIDFLKNVVVNFESQNYPMLFPTDLITHHYCWWRPGKFKELRYDLINRADWYWQNFEKGLVNIRNSKDKNDVVLRSHLSENELMRYATHVEFDQPKHVKEHPNFLGN